MKKVVVPSTIPASAAGPVSKPQPSPSVQEFSIRVPKTSKKKYQVMRFNSNLGVNFVQWKKDETAIKMERENNMKEFRHAEEEAPKFGAGSEFGKEAKEEARRKKYGFVSKKYKPDDQPWILKIGGKSGKKFKGIREGGVSDNTAYYVFTQAGKGIIEAYPLQEWYKFQPIQRYKALSAEEAEEEFGRRNKIINYFSVMMKKRLRNEEDGELDDIDETGKAKKGGSKKKERELKISEMDDWVESDEDLSGSDEEEKKKDDDDEDEAAGKGKKKGKGKGKGPVKKKKKKDSDDEAFEESDDGDEEGRELDYISDSSDSASDHEMKANKELKGVAEEDALRKLLNSESEEEEESEEKKKENESHSDEDEKNKKESGDKEKGDKSKDDSSKKKKKKDGKGKKSKVEKKSSNGKGKDNDDDSSSELSPNTTDTDSDAPVDKNKSAVKGKEKESNNRSGTPTLQAGEKRKLSAAESAVAAAKKAKLDTSSSSSSSYLASSSESGVTEDAVRRYLMRKPMTTTELLQKFKTKKTGLSSEQLVNLMTQILKNINPHRQMIKNKMYLSIKPM